MYGVIFSFCKNIFLIICFFFSYFANIIATIIGTKFIKINNIDEPIVLPSGYKLNKICPTINVINNVAIE